MRYASTGSRAASRPARPIESRARDAEAGFTLLETLTALTILSIALVSLFQANEAGLRTVGTSTDFAQARIIAQSLLADAVSGWTGPLASKSGREGRFAWSVDVRPEGGALSEVRSNWRLNRIHVTVAWDRDRRIELDTLKLGRARELTQ